MIKLSNRICRFYTFGLGPEACPNLVQGMAGAGRGKAYFIADDERIPDKVGAFITAKCLLSLPLISKHLPVSRTHLISQFVSGWQVNYLTMPKCATSN